MRVGDTDAMRRAARVLHGEGVGEERAALRTIATLFAGDREAAIQSAHALGHVWLEQWAASCDRGA